MPFKRFRFACLAIFSLAALNCAATASAETLVARVLDPFEMPKAVAIDPLDDNDETMAAVALIKTALEERGIAVRSDADHVFEIEVDPAARGAYLSRSPDAAAAGAYHEGRRDNPVDELAPSPELAPRGPELVQPRALGESPHLAVILMLYKRQQPPGWMARAVAPRDNRPINDQVRALTGLAMLHFGESAAIGFKQESTE